MPSPDSQPFSPPASSRETSVWLAALVLVAGAVAAYLNTFSVPFLFDDIPAIVENPAIRHPWTAGASAAGQQAGGLTTSGRPVVTLSLALNHAASGDAVWSYHAVNLAIHLGAGLLLFGIVRRTLQSARLRDRFGPASLPLGFVVAAAWTLHPLQTESVTYIVQRAEALAGFFYLLTLYAFIRSATARNAFAWRALAAVACLLGMASKEVVVSAPLIVFLYDGIFISGTFRRAWQRHRGFHLGLGATWVVLAVLVAGTGSRGGTAGFGTAMSSWRYALTQCDALVRYVALSLWPASLTFDYGLETVQTVRAVWLQALVVVGFVVAVAIALWRRPPLGFLGVCFLALLAPSSSFVPVMTQTMAEHRMYLPLAVVTVACVLAGYRLAGARTWPVGGAVLVALAVATVARNHTYRTEVGIWRDTAGKRPLNARAHNNLGQALFRAGKVPESIPCYETALRLQPSYPETHYNLGVSLAHLGRIAPALAHYEAALRFQPGYPEAHNNLGNALVQAGRVDEALRHYEQALAARPDFAEAENNFGNALLQLGQTKEAAARIRRAIELKPDYAEAHYNLGNAEASKGAMPSALASYEQALRLRPDYADAHVNAGNALLALGRAPEALDHYAKAVALSPRSAAAHFNQGSALLELGRWADAVTSLEHAVQLDPKHPGAARALAFALAKAGRPAEALRTYETYLRASPGDAEAREEMQQLRASAASSR